MLRATIGRTLLDGMLNLERLLFSAQRTSALRNKTSLFDSKKMLVK